jgi:hypothetical protein
VCLENGINKRACPQGKKHLQRFSSKEFNLKTQKLVVKKLVVQNMYNDFSIHH